MRRDRAVVLVQLGATPYPDATNRQQLAVLDYLREHRYVLTAVTADEDSVVALIAAGHADVAIAFLEDATLRELKRAVLEHGGRFEALHARRYLQTSTRARQIHDAAGRGADPATIALVLGIDVADVLDVLDHHTPTGDARRPMRRDRPGQPPDHPWRSPLPDAADRRPNAVRSTLI